MRKLILKGLWPVDEWLVFWDSLIRKSRMTGMGGTWPEGCFSS